ncbi:MAG TPA: hypothetical protein V6D22_22925 [Candidatus Obscuribacterales bacterium]
MLKVSLAAALALSFLAAPVLADDPGAPIKRKPPATRWNGAGNFAARVASTAVTAPLGLPVAAVRLVLGNDVEQAKSIPYLGESPHKPFVWLSRGIVIPSAVFVGLYSAPIYTTVNSWRVNADKPFSPEAFSFGKLDETITPY